MNIVLERLRIRFWWFVWGNPSRIITVVAIIVAVGGGFIYYSRFETARVAAFTPEYKASIASGEQILDSAQVGDFIVTRGGVYLQVWETGVNDPSLDRIAIRSFPNVTNCANGRRGPVVRGDMTLSRIVGRIPAKDGKPNPVALGTCRDQGSIALHDLRP